METKTKLVCERCGKQIGWIENGEKIPLKWDCFAVDDDTGQELCAECFRTIHIELELTQSYQPAVWEDIEDKIADLLAREGLKGHVTCSATDNTTEIRIFKEMGRSD
jgi:hypothetical protein